jgi:hypothetical protein
LASRTDKNLNIRSWPAAPSAGAAVGVLALLLSLGAAAATAVLFYNRIQEADADLISFAVGLVLFLALLASFAFGYWLVALFRLRYSADRNALTINWGGISQVVPMPSISALIPAAELTNPPHLRRFAGVRWPGYHVGQALVEFSFPLADFRLEKPTEALSRELTGGIALPAPEPQPPTLLLEGDAEASSDEQSSAQPAPRVQHAALVYATASERKLLYIVTDELVYAISPANQEQFIAEFNARHALAPTDVPAQTTVRHGFAAHPIWGDSLGQGIIALALLINAALFAYLCLQLPADARFLVFHWNAQGLPDNIAPALDAFHLPAFALVIVAVNIVIGLYIHLRDSSAAHFLYAGAAAVQVVFLAALFNIINF